MKGSLQSLNLRVSAILKLYSVKRHKISKIVRLMSLVVSQTKTEKMETTKAQALMIMNKMEKKPPMERTISQLTMVKHRIPQKRPKMKMPIVTKRRRSPTKSKLPLTLELIYRRTCQTSASRLGEYVK